MPWQIIVLIVIAGICFGLMLASLLIASSEEPTYDPSLQEDPRDR